MVNDYSNTNSRLNAILFCAVSSERQAKDDKVSLDFQESEGRAVCEARGWQIVDVLKMAHSRDYTDFYDLLADARRAQIDVPDRLLHHWQDRDFDLLVVWDGDRLGRTTALIMFVAAKTVRDAGAHIYCVNDSRLIESEDDFWILLTAYRARHENKKRVEQWHAGMSRRAANGLPVSSSLPISHRLVRDPDTGKAVKVIVDESRRQLWDDLATVFLEGVGYTKLEPELYQRFGQTDNEGKPFQQGFFRALLFTPTFWGHEARFYKKRYRNNSGAWAFDLSVSPPEGVEFYPNKFEPVYTGEQADIIIAEIHRRSSVARGKARPSGTYKFSGLLLCGECGCLLVYSVTFQTRYRYIRCNTNKGRYANRTCGNSKIFKEAEVQAWFHALLHKALMLNGDIFDAQPEDTDQLRRQAHDLEKRIEQSNERARVLIREQSIAGDALQATYREMLQEVNTDLARLTGRMREAHAALERKEVDRRHQTRVLEQIRSLDEDVDRALEQFWALPGHEVNQLLHRLMQQRRWVVYDGAIRGTAEVARSRNR